MSALPTFLIIGAAKCGTTSLFRMLASHPEVGACATKEPSFFAQDAIYARGMDWYASLFADVADRPHRGEASTQYSDRGAYPDCAVRLARDLPDVRLIYAVRHPYDRVASMWRHLASGYAIGDFAHELADPARAHLYAGRSRYSWQLDAYREHFSEDRLLILTLEHLEGREEATLDRVGAFLGLSTPFPPFEQRRYNIGGPPVASGVGRVVRRWVPDSLRRALPQGMRSSAARALGLSRPPIPRPTWRLEQLQRLADAVASDARRLLQDLGLPADYWELDPERYLALQA